MPLLIIFLGIILLLILTIQFRVHAFLALILVALGIGLAQGMGLQEVLSSLQKGVGSTLGYLALVLGLGAMLGGLLEHSGAAQQITDRLIRGFGQKYIIWALVLAGFIIGLPMFYTVGFVMMIPLIFSVAKSTGLPILYLAIPMVSALSVTHGFLPPHPGPTTIAVIYKADMGLTFLYGLCIAIPTVIVAGPLFGSTFRRLRSQEVPGIASYTQVPEDKRPSLFNCFLTALLPVILMSISALAELLLDSGSLPYAVLRFMGEPVMALLLSVLLAIYTLGLSQGRTMPEITEIFGGSIQDIAMILLIIGGGGALKQILVDSGTSDYIVDILDGSALHPLFLVWLIAAALRITLGSATVAALTAAGIASPLIAQASVNPELLVLVTGAGSLTFSQVNDTGFWLFKEYFNLSIAETFRSWTMMETLVSIMGLLGCLLLDILI